MSITGGILMLNIFLYKFLDNRNRSLSIKTKLLLGMICAFISMCLAGSVEVIRESRCPDNTTASKILSSWHLVLNLRFRSYSSRWGFLFIYIRSITSIHGLGLFGDAYSDGQLWIRLLRRSAFGSVPIYESTFLCIGYSIVHQCGIYG